MKRILNTGLVCFIFFLFNGNAALLDAGQVTMEVSTTTSSTPGKITARVRITNKGPDPARDVSVIGQFQAEQQRVFIGDHLRPGQSAEGGVVFNVPADLIGTYPLFVTVIYTHSDGINVSSASLAKVTIGSAGKEILSLKAEIVGDAGNGAISVQVQANEPSLGLVTITPHAADDLSVAPSVQQVRLEKGKGKATFKAINISGNADSAYGIFFAAEYDTGNLHGLATADIVVPVQKMRPVITPALEHLQAILTVVLLACAVIVLIILIISSTFRQWLFSLQRIPHLLDILVLAAAEIFIFSKFDLASLITATTTTGGDTASHYYTLDYLRHTLLPAGRISGWTMGNYAGFPILQFYFPLPFLLMCLLDLVMPLQVAFKLVTLLGTALLPVAAYTMLRLIRCPFPGPGIGALLMLPFLFNGANSMWGGNILSTLAGEFSYSLSMALSLILIGSLYRGALAGKGIIRNAILVFLVGFSHGYTLLFAEAMSLFLLATPYGFNRRVIYLFKVYGLGFCLLAFWLLPLLVFTRYTTAYHLVWTINSVTEVVPKILLPVIIAGIGGSLVTLVIGIMRQKENGSAMLGALTYLWFGLAVAVVFFVAAPRIGVVDIRYVPYGQLMLCFMAAFFLGWTATYSLNRWGLNWLLLIVMTAAVMLWTNSHLGPVTGWTKWNYEGFEAKKSWPVYEQLNKTLAGNFGDPRVVFEHSQDHNTFGSSRAFESLPYFAGRATLEGLYMQASITAPFVFYIQSIVSRESSQPFPQYSYTTMDFNRARRYLNLFNVSDLIIRSREAKQAIRQVPAYELSRSIGQYEIWKFTENSDNYVTVLDNEPIHYQGGEPWKEIAHQWFSRDALDDVSLIFNDAATGNNESAVHLTADSLEALPRQAVETTNCTIRETIGNEKIFFETTCPGKPHLVKISFHPNWQVKGAAKIHLVTPSFMLVYPQDEKVHLYYGPGPWDRLGQVLTLFGLAVILLQLPLPGKGERNTWSMVKNRLNLPEIKKLRFLPDPGPGGRKAIMLTVVAAAFILVAIGSYRTYSNEPYRIYNQSIRYKDQGLYEKARAGFRSFIQKYPLANLARESSYYIAITYYLEKNDPEARKSFVEYLARYPQGSRVAEVRYHLGLVLLRSGKKDEGVRTLQLLINKHPGSSWAGYAKERLQEHGAIPAAMKLNINSSNLDEYMGRAITFFNQEKLDAAKPIFLQISQEFPEFEDAVQALAALALCYYKEGDCSTTIKYYQQLVARYPNHQLAAEAFFHLALCFEKTGNKGLAKEAYGNVIKSFPDTTYARQALEILQR